MKINFIRTILNDVQGNVELFNTPTHDVHIKAIQIILIIIIIIYKYKLYSTILSDTRL